MRFLVYFSFEFPAKYLAWPDGPLDEDPGEAGHAEKHRDGQQDVGDEAEQHGGPVDLNIRRL